MDAPKPLSKKISRFFRKRAGSAEIDLFALRVYLFLPAEAICQQSNTLSGLTLRRITLYYRVSKNWCG
jgi:hypothetical protein